VLWLTPPSYVRTGAVPALERGRRRAGRSLDGFTIACAVPLAVTDDRTSALEAFRGELTRYLTLPFYRAMLEAAGCGEGLREFDRTGRTPATLAEALGAVGDPEGCRAYVAAYRQAGVTLPAVRPILSPEAPWYTRTLDAAAEW
jgi:alkanesulfonate monooxygenase SsuD/methylene tetrahydromethanopterin reductase-like flavin-dependent oxidoreductase (luciferase family)